MKQIAAFEPWVFIFFGTFHLHRIWGLFDRKSYADFWLDVLEHKNLFYFVLMGLLAVLCVLGLKTFLKNLRHNYWWRWIYVFGGGYVLFDVIAILIGWEFWHELILKMYDISASYWNILWSLFVLMGGAVFTLGIKLLVNRHHELPAYRGDTYRDNHKGERNP